MNQRAPELVKREFGNQLSPLSLKGIPFRGMPFLFSSKKL